ncbi:MAG TPA: MauE/DoxX family redox-associated membrane protein, partial [Ktedonobacteraceae bacterium]|nr:MauE/DoxX family redox-associated membrane protein [Ktedonobacteraceae bacterium]
IAGIILPLTASIAILLLFVFTIAIALNLARGRQFSCHCFGSSSATSIIGPVTILRNLLLIAIALFLALSTFSPFSTFNPQNLGLAAIPWQSDLQLLTHLDTFIPMIVTVTIVLSIFALLNEVDAMLQIR